ncbi:tetratricopeptide repeat protein [Victivallis sp. Marseille-Q1083]|uniref:tetratricopeptide repeat protein n=1 Tax=Victivallis sp. Marseille-Q1083 TaxID=2717288 RepID=UPI00158D0F70|nr:tetratricopeptide repeat protein [Victivallis sp. Marseille-Q1083]
MKKATRLWLFGSLLAITLVCIAVVVYLLFSHRSLADALYEGQQAYAAHDYETAKKALREVIRKDQANENAIRLLAEIFEEEKQFATAAVLFQRAAGLNPLDAALAERQLNMLDKAGNYPEIIWLLRAKFETDQLPAEQLPLLGRAAAAAGDDQLLAAVIAKLPDSETPEAKLLYAEQKLAERNPEEAARLLEAVLTADSAQLQGAAQFGLARYALLRGDLDAVRQHLELANQLDGDRNLKPLASFCFDQGDFPAAIPYLQELLQRDARDFVVAVMLGEALAAANDAAALTELSKQYASGDRPTLVTGYYLEALRSFLTNDKAQLTQVLDNCSEFANRMMYQRMQLQLVLDGGNLAKLAEALENVYRRNPTTETAEQLLNLALPLLTEALDRGEFAATLPALRQLRQWLPQLPGTAKLLMISELNTGNFSAAVANADTVLRSFPDDADALLVQLQAQLQAGQPVPALEAARKLQQLAPEDPNTFIALAAALESGSRIDEAWQAYQDGLAQLPDSELLLANAFNFALRHQKEAEAEELIRRCAATDRPERQAAAQVMTGELAALRGQPEQEIAAYRQALKLDPRQEMLYLRLAECLKAAGKTDEQLACLREGLHQFPDQPQLLYAWAYLAAVRDDYAEAEKTYQRLRELYPQDRLVLVNFSEVLAAAGRNDEALALAKQAKDGAVDFLPGWECLGMRYLEAKKYPDAVRELNFVWEQAPDNQRVREALQQALEQSAQLYWTEKQYREAGDACRQLLKLDKNNSKAVQMLQLIEKVLNAASQEPKQ